MVIEHGDSGRGRLARLWRRLSGMPEPLRPEAERAPARPPSAAPGGTLPPYPGSGAPARPIVTADEIERTSFEATRFREGYDPAEVDAFLRRVVDDLRRPPGHQGLTARDVVDVRFHATKFREGYDQDEVDELLERVHAELLRRAAQG